jgi:hypothetical protein
MRVVINLTIDPDHLNLVESVLDKRESRSSFFVKSALIEAYKRQEVKK